MILVGLLTQEEKDLLTDQILTIDWYYNPVKDCNDDWVISSEEIDNTTNEEFLWVKDLPMIEWCNPIPVTGDNSTGSTTYLDASAMFNNAKQVSGLTFSCKFSKLVCNGTNTTSDQSRLSSLRLTNVGSGQWGGSSPQIDISYTQMSTAALNLLFADMAAQGAVTSKTINITSATGAAGLSAGDRLVITSLGWTITG